MLKLIARVDTHAEAKFGESAILPELHMYIYIIFIYINYYLPRSPTKISRAMLGAATQGSCTKSQVGFPFWVQERYETHGKYSWKIGKSAQKVCPNQEIIFQAGVCLGMVGIPTRMP